MRIHAFLDPDPDPKHCLKRSAISFITLHPLYQEGPSPLAKTLRSSLAWGPGLQVSPINPFLLFHILPPPPHVSSVGREGE
jgi:hypothetical protein